MHSDLEVVIDLGGGGSQTQPGSLHKDITCLNMTHGPEEKSKRMPPSESYL